MAESSPQVFPVVEGGGSLMLAWQVRNKKVLVVGGGEVCPFLLMKTRFHHASSMARV